VHHLKAINKKAARIEDLVEQNDVVALQFSMTPRDGAHIPLGCSFVFAPGWEADVNGSTAGLCQPVERDIYDCYLTCFWPAHVPDHLNYAPDWTGKCASAQKDWRKIDLIFP
jgi:Quinohemoprotein amine dehydrogenase, gamma subunit